MSNMATKRLATVPEQLSTRDDMRPEQEGDAPALLAKDLGRGHRLASKAEVVRVALQILACELAALAMNILRLTGQSGLLGPQAPVRHDAKRRRMKTVMQELIDRAGRLIETGRRIILGLGANDRSAAVFKQMHLALAGAT